jgi:hypothetical protein
MLRAVMPVHHHQDDSETDEVRPDHHCGDGKNRIRHCDLPFAEVISMAQRRGFACSGIPGFWDRDFPENSGGRFQATF